MAFSVRQCVAAFRRILTPIVQPTGGTWNASQIAWENASFPWDGESTDLIWDTAILSWLDAVYAWDGVIAAFSWDLNGSTWEMSTESWGQPADTTWTSVTIRWDEGLDPFNAI